jgi:hypothetical protein
MSNNESFIDEVTEEVRRDKLYAAFRKYGWIGIVAVLGIVGGTAWNEWQQSQKAASAQAFGDAVIDVLDQGSPEDRMAALTEIPAEGDQAALLRLILSTDPVTDKAGTLKALGEVAAMEGLLPKYRDLAVLRGVIVAGADVPLADRRKSLESIAVAGRPYRVLANEQLALLLIEEGKPDEAIKAFLALRQDQEASQGLRGRVDQMIVALGGTVPVEG